MKLSVASHVELFSASGLDMCTYMYVCVCVYASVSVIGDVYTLDGQWPARMTAEILCIQSLTHTDAVCVCACTGRVSMVVYDHCS